MYIKEIYPAESEHKKKRSIAIRLFLKAKSLLRHFKILCYYPMLTMKIMLFIYGIIVFHMKNRNSRHT